MSYFGFLQQCEAKTTLLKRIEELSLKLYQPMVIEMFCFPHLLRLRNYETLSDNAAPTVRHSAAFIGSLQALDMTSASNGHFASILPSSFEGKKECHHYRDGIYLALSSMADINVRNGVIDEAIGPVSFREIDQAGRIHRAKRKAFTTRLIFALLGGTSLIGLILIMTLHA